MNRKQKPRQAHSISTGIAPGGSFCVQLHDADGNVFAFGNLDPAMARMLCINIVTDLAEMRSGPLAECEGTA